MRQQITRGEDFKYEFTVPEDEMPDGEDIGLWTLEVRFGTEGQSDLFTSTPAQDPENDYRFTGTVSAATTAAISSALASITAAVWRTDFGSATCLHENGVGVEFPVVNSVNA